MDEIEQEIQDKGFNGSNALHLPILSANIIDESYFTAGCFLCTSESRSTAWHLIPFATTALDPINFLRSCFAQWVHCNW